MMDKKGPYLIKELKSLASGTQLWGKYLIIDKIGRKTKDGREIIELKLGDQTGEIGVIVWDNCPISGKLEIGAVIGLLGDMGIYNNRVQITAKRIKVLDEDPQSYLQSPGISIDKLIQEFDRFLMSIQNPFFKEVLQRVFSLAMKESFFKAPAAKKIHHNYSGGLLEHTLTVAALCQQAALTYEDLNLDLLISGALLHDIGKVSEYEIKVSPQYTNEGRLLGHIILGTEILSAAIAEMKNEGILVPVELEWMLKHMLVSHHGALEFGSPVIPLFPEAFVLNMMDNMDAKMFVFKRKIEENDGEEELFTNYDNFFGQHFFTYRYKEFND
ncbi:MAG: HDIG domain-containing protein [Syntrophomonadaceae bacterium]|nr:HDIG domain-containing protein [Syntrophomonadaceae bacterium]MDD3023876.1 HDIG domain-containing protein [Syntrophomonadaceae bacterium]